MVLTFKSQELLGDLTPTDPYFEGITYFSPDGVKRSETPVR